MANREIRNRDKIGPVPVRKVTKRDQLVELLVRDEGATLDQDDRGNRLAATYDAGGHPNTVVATPSFAMSVSGHIQPKAAR